MGENKASSLSNALVELEQMYSGVPDESVDFTFQHLANLKQNPTHSQNKAGEETNVIPLRNIPTLDFGKGTEVDDHHHHHHYQHHRLDRINEDRVTNSPFRATNHHCNHDHMGTPQSCIAQSGFRHSVESAGAMVGRRRMGIPHSKICALCSTYTYLFRHRCLVCGRVYCRQCVRIGMGEMTEGRKCIDCLGRRFSQRYIERAGESGCFCSRYPKSVRQVELKWAEKGPRKISERPNGMRSRSRSPMGHRTPNGAHGDTELNSFAMSSSFSPYTPTHHQHFPF